MIETPQYFLLRVACGLSRTPAEAIEFYRLMSSLAYLPSARPTLFNSGTRHTQMSSCYLVDSPRDELDSIYERYQQVARLSKFAGGIGIACRRVRSRGALIRGTNGQSNGIVPFLRTLDCSVAGGQPGRPAQGRGLRLPRDRGTRTSRSSSNCGTTPARTPAARTTSTWPTGSRTSSCAGSRPTSCGR